MASDTIDFLGRLPPELALYIISYLPVSTFAHLSPVCRSYLAICNDSIHWMHYASEKYPHLVKTIPNIMSHVENIFEKYTETGIRRTSIWEDHLNLESGSSVLNWRSFCRFLNSMNHSSAFDHPIPFLPSETSASLEWGNGDMPDLTIPLELFDSSLKDFLTIAERKFDLSETGVGVSAIAGFFCSMALRSKNYPSKLGFFRYAIKSFPLPMKFLRRVSEECLELKNIESSDGKEEHDHPRHTLHISTSYRLPVDTEFLELNALVYGDRKLPEILTKLKVVRGLKLYWPSGMEELARVAGNNSSTALDTVAHTLEFLSLSGFLPWNLTVMFDKMKVLVVEKIPGPQLCRFGHVLSHFANLTSLKLTNVRNLSVITREICTLKNLRRLVMIACGISVVPDEIAQLTNLVELDLSINSLTSIPPSMGKLKNLMFLGFRRNKLRSLPRDIVKLENLIKFVLPENKISYLPIEIGELRSLTCLDLSANYLRKLPDSITNCASMRVLRLERNQLITLPRDIGKMTYLSQLHASFNRLTSLPDSIKDLRLLRLLSIGRNLISSLPPGFSSMRSLFGFNGSYMKLSALPEDIGKLQELVTIDVSSNCIKSLPDSIGDCSSLRHFMCSRNYLVSVPDSLWSVSPHMHVMDLRHNRISKVSDDVAVTCRLDSIRLEGNALRKVPNFLKGSLHLSRNKISRLPDSLFRDGWNVTHLYLKRNSISRIPQSIRLLANTLDVLKLDGNPLVALPNCISELKSLTVLSLNETKIAKLPSSITKMRRLTILLLNNSLLAELPTNIGSMSDTSLVRFEFMNCRVTELPVSIFEIYRYNIKCSGNPFSDVAIESMFGHGWVADNSNNDIHRHQFAEGGMDLFEHIMNPERLMGGAGFDEDTDGPEYVMTDDDDDVIIGDDDDDDHLARFGHPEADWRPGYDLF